MSQSLILPDDFDPQKHMIAKITENGVFHESRAGARLAEELVANGTPEDMALAEKVLTATLACQELRPDDPHYGNFYWMAEDDTVGDLNAVEFNLERLIPMMLRYQDRLSSDMQARIRETIRLGLQAITKLDVRVTYSNIAVLDILNSVLGGEYLDDAVIRERGYQKLVDWMAYTNQHGIPREHNSPTYTPVIIRALNRLVDLAQHEPTRIRADTMIARMALSAGLHIHSGTGRWAGPHSRAYHPSVICETPPERTLLESWIADGHAPAWIADLLREPSAPLEVTETADVETGMALTTYHSPSFSLGVSTCEYGNQSNVLMAHYVRAGGERPGILYSRYLLDDKWLGDFYHATDRTKSRNLIEEGRFYGVQHEARAIGLYAPQVMGTSSSAKAVFILTERALIDEIWVGQNRVEKLPVDVPEGENVVFGSGSTWIAIRPLQRTELGRHAPIQLVEKQGDLVLEIYNYLGSMKPFWNMQPGGPFFKGFPQCGVFIEMAERSTYPDDQAFEATVAGGILTDEVDASFVYDSVNERLWTVEYERNGQVLGIQIDLMDWKLKRRWTHNGDLGWPMLDSPIARQTRTGEVTVEGATLTCTPGVAVWLYGNSQVKRWVAGYHGQAPGPLKLTLPDGEIEIEAISTGIVSWDAGAVRVEAIGLNGIPKIKGGQLVE